MLLRLVGALVVGSLHFKHVAWHKNIACKIDPSTSVSTYIVQSNETAVKGINVFDAKVDLTLTDMKSIAHGFGRIEDEQDEIVAEEITLGHILKNLLYKFQNKLLQT